MKLSVSFCHTHGVCFATRRYPSDKIYSFFVYVSFYFLVKADKIIILTEKNDYFGNELYHFARGFLVGIDS